MKSFKQLYSEVTDQSQGQPNKFEVGEFVKVININSLSEEDAKKYIGTISRIVDVVSVTKGQYERGFNAIYHLETGTTFFEDELEAFNLNVKPEDKQTASDLLDV